MGAPGQRAEPSIGDVQKAAVKPSPTDKVPTEPGKFHSGNLNGSLTCQSSQDKARSRPLRRARIVMVARLLFVVKWGYVPSRRAGTPSSHGPPVEVGGKPVFLPLQYARGRSRNPRALRGPLS